MEYAAFGPDRALYLISERGASRRQILKLPAGDFALAHARIIVPEGDEVIALIYDDDLLAFPAAGWRFAISPAAVAAAPVRSRRSAAWRGNASACRSGRRDRGGRERPTLPRRDYLTPRASTATCNRTRRRDGFASPARSISTAWKQVRVTAKSADGTQVPLNIIRAGPHPGRPSSTALRRRLRHEPDALVPARRACVLRREACLRSPTSAAAVSSVSARPGCADLSRTCSMTSSRRHGWRLTCVTRRRRSWRFRAAQTVTPMARR